MEVRGRRQGDGSLEWKRGEEAGGRFSRRKKGRRQGDGSLEWSEWLTGVLKSQ